ncbi:hypothetical protein BCR44DRAFT_35015 [Catenaria anguillulae PL171]|uniref:BTB domain-containing protein n=1 Tax=Catenaria anguillulae PL171 TaxID=765915 RepID=A0A1Y2HD78_9FUNG|nr:hypothetical protein BCR44DRAFT_35015 [Catenaria anguillulae PL171]
MAMSTVSRVSSGSHANKSGRSLSLSLSRTTSTSASASFSNASQSQRQLAPPKQKQQQKHTHNSTLILTKQLTALLDNRTCIDLTVHITTTQLHTAQFLGHAAMLADRGPHLIDGFLDKPLTLDPNSNSTDPSIVSISVHCNHARLNDLLTTCRSLYTDPQLAVPHLTHLLATSLFSDCTLVVEDPLGSTLLTSTRAHKFILAARCPYFSTLFQSSFADTHLPSYSLPIDIFSSPQIFDNVLAFIYTGHLHTHPTSPLHVFDLFQCANYLGMTTLEAHLEHVLRTMVHGLDTCTCTSCSASLPAVLLFADRINLNALRTDAIQLFASSPLTLWTSLDFPTFPTHLQSMILAQFTLAAEHDPGSLLAAIVVLDTLIDRLTPRSAAKPTAKLVDALTALRDTGLIPQLIPALPHLVNTGTLDRPPAMDIGRRLDVLRTHVIPHRMDPGNAVMIAFTLATTYAARVQRATNASDESSGAIELDAQVTEALGGFAHLAIEWVAKRWINVPLVAPRGVYPASAAWVGFVERVATKVGVSVDEVVAAAAVGVGGSVIGGGSGSVVGVKARQPRVRSMVIEGGARPGVKVAGAATKASTATTVSGKAVVGSRVDAGRSHAAPPRPASMVGGMVGASSSTPSPAAPRRASTLAATHTQQPLSRPLARVGPPMNSALRAERARSMLVNSSATSSNSVRPTTSTLRPASSLTTPSTDPTRGRPGSTASATVVVARKVTRSPSVISSASSSVSTTATTARRAREPSSTRPVSSSSQAPSSAIRRTVSMATLSSSRTTTSASSTPSSPLKKPATSPSSPSRLRPSSTSLSSSSSSSSAIPPVPPLPSTVSSSLGLSERKYDSARLERLRRKSAESAARVALNAGASSVAAVDLSTFRPSRIPAPRPSVAANADMQGLGHK